ncbi:hypothetical protein EV122DRAFT_283605 [Schizophyllum commune]
MVNDRFEKATAFLHIVKDLRDDECHPTTKKKRQELDKKARRAIDSRPLDPLLRAPPFDTPARKILVTDDVDDILASLEAVYEASLSPSLSRDQGFLRYVFTLWPALCKWSVYLAVPCRLTILSHREWISTITIHVAIRAQLALTGYLKLKKSLSDWSFILAADHSALFALTISYLSNSRLEFGIHDTASFPSNSRIPTYPFHLKALAQTCAEHIGLCIDIHKQLGNVAPAVSSLQATVRSKPGRLYNAIGRYIRMISCKDDMSDSDLTVHFSLIVEFMVHPELAVCRFSRTTVANLLLGLHRISTAPPAHAYPPTTLDALWSIFGMIRGSGQMATVVAVKSGLVDKFAALASRPSADLAPFYRAAGCDPGESWTTTQPSASFWELAGGVGVLAKAMSEQHLAARCSKRDVRQSSSSLAFLDVLDADDVTSATMDTNNAYMPALAREWCTARRLVSGFIGRREHTARRARAAMSARTL